MNNNSKIDSIFAEATDFELTDAVHGAIEDLYGFDAILEKAKNVPFDRWVVHTVIANTGYFETNGYSYFWGTKHDHHGFAEALKVIGKPILAQIVETSIKKVPKDILGDWDKVDEYFGSYEKRLEAAIILDAKLINEHPDIVPKVSKYIRKNRIRYYDVIDKIEKSIMESRKLFEQYES